MNTLYKMRDNLNINDRINKIAEYFFGGNNVLFAKKLNTNEANIRNYRSKTTPKIDFIVKLNEILEISFEWILVGKEPMFLKNTQKPPLNNQSYIPLIPIHPHHTIECIDKELTKDHILDSYLIPEFKQRGIEYIIRMSGVSMYPKYSNGDLLGCKFIYDTSFFQWGEVYVLNTKQGTMIKRLFPCKNEDFLECRSDNEEYPPFSINKKSIYGLSIVLGILKLE